METPATPSPAAPTQSSRILQVFRLGWLLALYGADRLIDAGLDRFAIARREKDLFLGTVFSIIGILSFHSGRYCDGNTADYLSCTRPATFYYYSFFDIALVVLGVFLILVWFVRKSDETR